MKKVSIFTETIGIGKNRIWGLSKINIFEFWKGLFSMKSVSSDFCKAPLARFPKVRTGRLDHSRTRHFGNEIGFFEEVLLINHLPLCIIFRIWLICWIVTFDLVDRSFLTNEKRPKQVLSLDIFCTKRRIKESSSFCPKSRANPLGKFEFGDYLKSIV